MNLLEYLSLSLSVRRHGFGSLLLLMGLLARPAWAAILTNGGFENGLDNWTSGVSSGGTATFAKNSSPAHWGTNAVLITVSNPGTASNSVQLVSSSFVASSSDTYVLRFWATTDTLRSHLGVNLLGATPVFPQIPFQISTNDNSYQEYLYPFRASGTVSIAFCFQTVANYWLDDVEIMDLTNNDGWDIPMTYLWRWGELAQSKTNALGWSGGDNQKSVLLPDGSVAWICNDSFISTVTNHFYTNVRGNCSLPRNTLVHQVGTNLYTLNTNSATFFVPTNTANIFWIGDGVVETNQLLVLLTEVNASSITRVGTAIGQVSLPSLKLESITEIPSTGADNYGPIIKGDDGYYYIYWDANVARVPMGSLAVSSAWTYWTNGTWVTNHALAAGGAAGLSGESSFVRLSGSNYVALSMPSLSTTSYAQFAPSPMGPWSRTVPLFSGSGEWGELFYMPNLCAGTGSNGIYTIDYSDNNSPEGLAKWASDRSWYAPHYFTANLWNLSPYSLTNGGGGPDARMSIKFAADQDYSKDFIDNRFGAGALNTTNWYNFYLASGSSSGATNVPYYTFGGAKYPSGAVIVYKWANEITVSTVGSNNKTLLDSFVNVNNNCWYLSVTNLDAPFTNGYNLYFYYRGNTVGWGGDNYVRTHSGQTSNSPALMTVQWNLFTTVTANSGSLVQDLTPLNTGASGETAGANYFVVSNLTGGAFDLLITNGNYGGVSAIEIQSSPLPLLGAQKIGGNLVLTWTEGGALLQATNVTGPWTTNPATSPYTNIPSAPRSFYRVKL